jgi:hypothetical protein
MSTNPIPSFIDAVRRRLDRGVASRLGARCLLAAAGACVLWAVTWRIFGYAAPWPGYAIAGGAGLVAFVISTLMSKRSDTQAAAAADEVFGLTGCCRGSASGRKAARARCSIFTSGAWRRRSRAWTWRPFPFRIRAVSMESACYWR